MKRLLLALTMIVPLHAAAAGLAAARVADDDDPLDATNACLGPLHGRSIEVDALESLDDVRTTILAITSARSAPSLRKAARAAVETAALDLVARRRGIAVATLLGGTADAPVTIHFDPAGTVPRGNSVRLAPAAARSAFSE